MGGVIFSEGYVIRLVSGEDRPAEYLELSGGLTWTKAAECALRFCRMADAAAFAALFVPFKTKIVRQNWEYVNG